MSVAVLMKWRDASFKYFSSEDSRQPGYIARRLKLYAKQQQEQKEARDAKISPITKKVAK